MKTYSTDLVNLLAAVAAGTVRVYVVDLFAIGPSLNGQMIYATNGGGQITFGGNIYHPVKFGTWSRDSVIQKVGLESQETRLTVLADSRSPVYFPGLSTVFLLDGVKYGLLDAAPVTIYTAYMTKYGTVVGPTSGSLVETKFVGVATSVDLVGITKAVIVVNDLIYLLNQQIPRTLFQASCSNVLYDAKCTLSASSFTRTGAVGTVVNSYQFMPSSTLTPISGSGTFAQGTLKWTSGNNSGLSCYCAAILSGPQTVVLDVPPLFPLHVGDTFTITEGCTKLFTSCINLQGSTNAAKNFAGQPTTPVPETAI